MSKDTGGGVKAVQQKSKVELLFISCGFPKFDSHEKCRLLPTVVPDPSAILIKVLQPYPVVPEVVRIFQEKKS